MLYFNSIQSSNTESPREYTFRNPYSDDSEDDTVFNQENDMRVIAHRGGNQDAPENTLEALEAAANNGYDTAEFDIRWTKDDVPIVLHDKTINRTARDENGVMPEEAIFCSNETYEDLLSYDFGSWYDDSFEGTKIPTYEELIKSAKEKNMQLYIEIKDSDFDDNKAEELVKIAKNYDMLDKISWISFDESYLAIIKNVLPNARLGYLSKEPIGYSTLEKLQNLKTDENDVFLDIKDSQISENDMELVESAGYDCEAWVVDNIHEAKYLATIGCDGITTNKLTNKDLK